VAHQFKYIIVGGGLAGASAIEGIRERDPSGSIALFGRESRLPYDRPPLSKGLWSGKATLDGLPVHDEGFYKGHGVHLFLSCEIASIDPAQQLITDKGGNHHAYQKLLLATGGTPRTLSFGGEIPRYFRTVDDYLALRDAAERAEDVVMIGGGFIGAELTAALTMAGKRVTLVFPEHQLLQKLLPEDLAGYVADEYRSRGVTLMADDLPVQLERRDGRAVVSTRGGAKIAADIAVAAIGLNIHAEMAVRAGLKVENGIVVDERLRTSDPNIFAAGDIANFPSRLLGKNMRIEHWDNARAQGKRAGENMAGAEKAFTYLPYMYSDIFDLGFEAVGEIDSRLQTYEDWKEEFREGVIYYLADDLVRGVLLWNVWEKVDAARRLIGRKKVAGSFAELSGVL